MRLSESHPYSNTKILADMTKAMTFSSLKKLGKTLKELDWENF